MRKKTTVAAQQNRVDPDVERLENQVSEAIGAKVSIRHANGGNGRLVIEYASLDELDALLEKLQKKPQK